MAAAYYLRSSSKTQVVHHTGSTQRELKTKLSDIKEDNSSTIPTKVTRRKNTSDEGSFEVERLLCFLQIYYIGEKLSFVRKISNDFLFKSLKSCENLIYHDDVLYAAGVRFKKAKVTSKLLRKLDYYDYYGIMDGLRGKDLPHGHFKFPTANEIPLPPDYRRVDRSRLPKSDGEETMNDAASSSTEWPNKCRHTFLGNAK